MKVLKFIIVALLLLSAGILIGIGYVWKNIAFAPDVVPRKATSSTAVLEQEVQGRTQTTPTTSLNGMQPITVSTSDLSEGQQKVLQTLGIDDQSITITPEAVMCATAALGETRAGELKAGAAPSLSEGLTLLSCLKK
ncbi:MAG: hypothetical protein RLZZ234_466 [Candidatus Parcubacteria bacterium]|jgi:hypothetical protein